MSEIKDFSDAHVGYIIPQNHAPSQICVNPSLNDIFNVKKKSCISGHMCLKLHAPNSEIMHAGGRVHPLFETLEVYSPNYVAVP